MELIKLSLDQFHTRNSLDMATGSSFRVIWLLTVFGILCYPALLDAVPPPKPDSDAQEILPNDKSAPISPVAGIPPPSPAPVLPANSAPSLKSSASGAAPLPGGTTPLLPEESRKKKPPCNVQHCPPCSLTVLLLKAGLPINAVKSLSLFFTSGLIAPLVVSFLTFLGNIVQVLLYAVSQFQRMGAAIATIIASSSNSGVCKLVTTLFISFLRTFIIVLINLLKTAPGLRSLILGIFPLIYTIFSKLTSISTISASSQPLSALLPLIMVLQKVGGGSLPLPDSVLHEGLIPPGGKLPNGHQSLHGPQKEIHHTSKSNTSAGLLDKLIQAILNLLGDAKMPEEHKRGALGGLINQVLNLVGLGDKKTANIGGVLDDLLVGL